MECGEREVEEALQEEVEEEGESEIASLVEESHGTKVNKISILVRFCEGFHAMIFRDHSIST